MKTIAFAAAVVAATLAVSAAATPAFAQAQGRFGAATISYNANSGRYCFRDRSTGAPMPMIVCKSKADWARDGLTIRHERTVVLAQR